MVAWPSTPTTPSSAPSTAGGGAGTPATMGGWNAVVGQSYQPTSFYTQARNSAGLTERFTQGLSPALFDIAGRVAGDASLPYGSIQALVRDALVHRLHWLEQNATDPELVNALAAWRQLEEVDHQMQAYARMTENIERLTETLNETCSAAVKGGDWYALWWLLDEAEQIWENVREPFATTALTLIAGYRSEIPEDVVVQCQARAQGRLLNLTAV